MREGTDPDDPQAELISDAVKLALGMSKDGARGLSDFLGDVVEPVGRAAGDHLRTFPTQKVGNQGGRLAGDAVGVALDVADAAKEGFAGNPETRSRTIDRMAGLVTFFGSMFVDTANKAVGTSAGQPATNRARLVTVEVRPGQPGTASVWVVNRGTVAVPTTKVQTSTAENLITTVKCEPPEVAIPPRGRARIDLTITHHLVEVGSFADVLLSVPGVGSIVVRVVVVPDNPSSQ